MTHFAKVEEGIVTKVIVAEPEVFDGFVDSSPGDWIQTSFNTIGGKNRITGGEGLRMNFAGIGFSYDRTSDAFIHPKPYESWTLVEEIGIWEPPVPMPTSGHWDLNEDAGEWDEILEEDLTGPAQDE